MRYFFHVRDNGARTPDEIGVELEDDAAARAEAARFLGELAMAVIPEDGGRRCGVEVVDARGRAVTAIGFSLDEGPDVGM